MGNHLWYLIIQFSRASKGSKLLIITFCLLLIAWNQTLFEITSRKCLVCILFESFVFNKTITILVTGGLGLGLTLTLRYWNTTSTTSLKDRDLCNTQVHWHISLFYRAFIEPQPSEIMNVLIFLNLILIIQKHIIAIMLQQIKLILLTTGSMGRSWALKLGWKLDVQWASNVTSNSNGVVRKNLGWSWQELTLMKKELPGKGVLFLRLLHPADKKLSVSQQAYLSLIARSVWQCVEIVASSCMVH